MAPAPMTDPRRFPPPWQIDETEACFIVRDRNKQALAYVYFEEEQGRRSAAKLLTKERSAADSGQYCEVAGAIGTAAILNTRPVIISPACHSPFNGLANQNDRATPRATHPKQRSSQA